MSPLPFHLAICLLAVLLRSSLSPRLAKRWPRTFAGGTELPGRRGERQPQHTRRQGMVVFRAFILSHLLGCVADRLPCTSGGQARHPVSLVSSLFSFPPFFSLKFRIYLNVLPAAQANLQTDTGNPHFPSSLCFYAC